MLANMRPAEVLRDLVDHLMSGGKKPERRVCSIRCCT